MLGPRDRENPMRETTAYRAISISSHMVGIPGHCEKECDFKIRNDEIQHWDPTGGHGTQREAMGPNGRPRDPTGGHGTQRRDPFFWLRTSTHTLPRSPGPLQSKLCLGNKACRGIKHAVKQSMLWNKACFSLEGARRLRRRPSKKNLERFLWNRGYVEYGLCGIQVLWNKACCGI